MVSMSKNSRFLGILAALLCICSLPLYGSGSGSTQHHPSANGKWSAGAMNRHSCRVHQGMHSLGINQNLPLLNALNPPCNLQKNHMGFLVLRGGGNLVKRRAKEARAQMKDRMSRAVAIRKKSGSIAKKAIGSRAAVAEYIQVRFTWKRCMFVFNAMPFCSEMFLRDQPNSQRKREKQKRKNIKKQREEIIERKQQSKTSYNLASIIWSGYFKVLTLMMQLKKGGFSQLKSPVWINYGTRPFSFVVSFHHSKIVFDKSTHALHYTTQSHCSKESCMHQFSFIASFALVMQGRARDEAVVLCMD
jgi:hypothetical protein